MNTRDAVAGNLYAMAGPRSTAGAARSALGATALFGLTSASACTSTESQVETGEMLPRPAVVVVDTFAISPSEVTLNEG